MKKIIPILILLFLATACLNSEPPVAEQANLSDSDIALDNTLFEEATSSNDLEKCEKILEEPKKVEWKKVVNSYLLTNQAINNLDSALCDQIQLERYKENCESEVNAKIEVSQKDQKKLETEQRAYDENNIDICDELEGEKEAAICKFNIIIDEAIIQKDSSLCDKIGYPEYVENCKSAATAN